MTGSLLRFPGARGAVTKYVNELSSIYGSHDRIDDPDVALAHDPAIYDKVMRDPVIAAAIHQREHSVAGIEWHMEPAGESPEDKLAAQVMEALLGRIKKFNQSRLELARAVLVGRTYSYVKGRRQRLSLVDSPVQDWWVPYRMTDIDKRRVVFEPSKEWTDASHSVITVTPKMWSVSDRAWRAIPTDANRALVRMIYQDREDRLGHGEGLIAPVYYYFWAKGVIWKRGIQYLRRWARGMLAVKVNMDRAGDTDKTNEEIADEFLSLFDKMSEGGSFVYGEGEEVSFMEASGTGQDMALNFMKYCDESIYRLLTGSVRPGGMATEGGGARAQAETEQDTSDILIQYDRSLLDEAITDWLVQLVWTQNRAAFSALGLGRAQMPSFATSKERREDTAELATTFETVLRAGIPVTKAEVYERLGIKQPGKDDEVFTAPEPAPQPGGGGLPFDAGRSPSFAFDETKVKRDAGKFAPKEGAGKAEEPPTAGGIAGREADAAASIAENMVSQGRAPEEHRDRIAGNWTRILGGNLAGPGDSGFDEIQAGVEENQRNPSFAALVAAHGEDTVIPVKGVLPDAGITSDRELGSHWSIGTVLNAGAIGGGKVKTGELKPGASNMSDVDGTAGLLRHEYAHGLWDKMNPETRDEFISSLPRNDTGNLNLPGIRELGLTSYASIKDDEAFAELIAIRTSPQWEDKKGEFPAFAREWGDRLMEELTSQ